MQNFNRNLPITKGIRLSSNRLNILLLAMLLVCCSLVDAGAATFTNTSSARFVNLSASMAVPRFRHTATLFSNGKVLVAGGSYNNYSSATNSAQIYNPAKGKFENISGGLSLGTARWGHTATMMTNGKALLVGGRYGGAGSMVTNTIEIVTQAGARTSSSATLATARYAHTATRLPDGRIVIAGGYDASGTPLNSVEIISADGSSVSAGTAISTPRGWHSATLLPDGRIVFIGGMVAFGTRLTSVEVYVPPGVTGTAGSFSFTTITGRAYHAAVLRPDGKILVIGGASPTQCEIVDPYNQTSAAGPTLDFPRYEPAAVVLPNGDVVVFGGLSGVTSSHALIMRNGTSYFQSLTGGGTGALVGHTVTQLPDGSLLQFGGRDTYLTFTPQSTTTSLIFTGSVSRLPATLPDPREGHTATRLGDGKVLIVGGYSTAAPPVNAYSTAVIYDPTTKTFSATTGSLATGRRDHTATLLPNGMVLIIGGKDAAGNPLGSAEVYSPASNSFSSLPYNLNTARRSHTATLLQDGRVVIMGGYGTGGALDSLELFIPGASAFQTSTDYHLATARYGHTATLLKNGKVLVVGGYDATDTALQSAEIFQPAAATPLDAWPGANNQLSLARRQHQATLLPDGTVLITGNPASGEGYDYGSEFYDPATNNFSFFSTRMGGAHAGGTATVLNDGRIFIAGGTTFFPDTAVDIYDSASRSFTKTMQLPSPRAGHAATLLADGTVLITGGRDNTSTTLSTADLYEFGVPAGRRPTLNQFATPPDLPIPQQPVVPTVAGSFNGDSEASGGTSPSAINHPLLRIRSLQSGFTAFADVDPANPWDIASATNTFTGLALQTLPQGVYGVTVSTSGVESLAQSIYVRPRLKTNVTNLSFNAPAGTSSSTGLVEIRNEGNVDLNINSILTTGNFSTTGGNCSTTTPLVQGTSCNAYVYFAPPGGSTGTLSGTLTIKSSDPDYVITPYTVSLSGTVTPTVTVTGSLPASGTIGVPYGPSTLSATGGVPGYTWSIVSGSLPPGITINSSTGTVSGTPTATGTYSFWVDVMDSSATPVYGSKDFSISIQPASLAVSTTTLPSFIVGTSYSTTLAASGGTPGYTWSVISGSLPAGLSLNSTTGQITGTPTTTGPYSFTVQVADSAATPLTASKTYSGTIQPPALSITTTSVPNAVLGTSYPSTTLTATGGTGPYSWQVTTAGTLPPGLSLDSTTGVISGTPTASGTFPFEVRVTDSLSTTAAHSYSISVSTIGNTLTGTVKNSAGTGIAGMWLSLNNTSGAYAGISSVTQSDGSFTIYGIPDGTYKILINGNSNYAGQWYNSRSSSSSADSITLTAGVTPPVITAVLQPGGTISGTVTTSTGAGATGATISVFDSNFNQVASMAVSNTDGTYTLPGVPVGSFFVKFFSATGGYVPSYYNGKTDVTLADPVVVAAGATTANINAVMQTAGAISGTVTNTSSTPIVGANVTVYDSTGATYAGYAYTGSDGTYTVGGIATGTYTVEFSAYGQNYVGTKVYNVSVTAGTPPATVNAILQSGGSIAGKITDSTGTGVLSAYAYAYDATTGVPAGSGGYTGTDGSYTISGLATGSYKVQFRGFSGNYISQYYDNQSSMISAAAISVTAGSTVSNINAVLQVGGSISGLVTDSASTGLTGVNVRLIDSSGNYLNYVTTTSGGSYSITGIPAGTYKVVFYSSSNSLTPNYYNNATSLPAAAPVTVAAGADTPNINATMAPASSMAWGGVTHVTNADGTESDALEIGINTKATTITGMTAAVTGPNGFSYTFTSADLKTYPTGQLQLTKIYPSSSPLAAGVYTFTLNDGNGNVSTRVDRHANPLKVPVVDSTTIVGVRKADGSYRMSWAPVNDTKTYYYRLKVNDSSGVTLYNSARSQNPYADIAAGSFTDGTPYQIRVELWDSASFDTTFNRSNSAFVTFTPKTSDYVGNLALEYANVYNRLEASGTTGTTVTFGFASSADAALVTAASVTGPNGFSYTFSIPGDLTQTGGNNYAKTFTTAMQTGLYTFNITANGQTQVAYATLTPAVQYPIPDATTYQVEEMSSGDFRFSWADVNHTGALYYRVYITDTVTNGYITSARSNQTYVDIPKAAVGDLNTKKWRVEIMDSTSMGTLRNRVNGPYTTAPLQYVAYDATRPVMGGFGIFNDIRSNGATNTNIWMGATDSDGTITSLRVEGPNGYTRELKTQGKPDSNSSSSSSSSSSSNSSSYRLVEAGSPQAGLYKFTATDNTGKTAVRYNYQPAATAIPAVDFTSFSTSIDPSGDPRLSWAPVAANVPVWYLVQLFTNTDKDNNGALDPLYTAYVTSTTSSSSGTTSTSLINQASVIVPSSVIPTGVQVLARVSVMDGSNFTTYNNRNQSVMTGLEAPGSSFATLKDADGDGYASNIDSNDNDPSVYPFSSGSATPGAVSGTITYSGSKAGRIYVAVKTNYGTLGTSVAATATSSTYSYIIRGVPAGSYTVNAFMDVLNVGSQVQTSPTGSVDITTTGTGYSGANITLTDQSPVAPKAPQNVGVSTGSGSVLVGWDRPRTNGIQSADTYDIYWGTSAAVSKSTNTGSRLNISASTDSPVFISGLTDSTALYFIVVPKSGGIEGTPSSAIGPITVGAPTGSNSVSGTVTYSGTAATGPLFVAVVSPQNKGGSGVYYTRIASPSASQAFTVTGVPNGSYRVYALFDMNNDGLFGVGDIMATDERAPWVTLTGSGASGVAISLTAKNSDILVTTSHGQSTSTSSSSSSSTTVYDWYDVDGNIRPQLLRPVRVTVTGVPSTVPVSVPMDLGLDKYGEFSAWIPTSLRPTVGDTYTYDITYADDTVEKGLTASVTGVSDAFPTNPQISSPVSTTPTFSWGAPASGAAGVKYSLWVGQYGNDSLWDYSDIPATQTSVVYNVDNRAGALQVGTAYYWDISTVDQYGNRATLNNTFIPTVADATAPTIVSTTPAKDATAVPVTVVLSAAFSEPIDSSTLPTTFLTAGTTVVTGTGSYDASSKTMTFTPAAPLNYNTTYTGTLSGIKDLAGNTMAPFAFSFTTAGPPDTTAPTIVSTTPASNAANVDIKVVLTAKLSEKIDSSTLPDQNSILKKGTTAITGTGSYDPTTDTITFTPAAPLEYSTTYTGTLSGIKDLAGNPMATYTFTFTTAAPPDTTAPTITAITPASGATEVAVNVVLTAKFSESIDSSKLPNANSILMTSGSYLNATWSYDAASHTLSLTPVALLASSTSYSATLAGIQDMAGNPMSPVTVTFTTGKATQITTDASGATTSPITVSATGGVSVQIPSGTTLTDASGRPLTGPLNVTPTPYGSSPPAAASSAQTTDGRSLNFGAAIDIVISSGSSLVKNISPAMSVKLPLATGFASAGSTVDVLSFDGTKWTRESTATVNTDGSVNISVTHLSIWAVAKIKYPTGKITSDDKPVNVGDALKALQIAVGMASPTAEDLANGDVAPLSSTGMPIGDKTINVGDAVVILQKAVGIPYKW